MNQLRHENYKNENTSTFGIIGELNIFLGLTKKRWVVLKTKL